MNYIGFYEELSSILEQYRDHRINRTEAEKRIEKLKQSSIDNDLNIEIRSDILSGNYLANFDEERSYEEDTSYDSSYDEDTYTPNEGDDESSF